jgi:acetyl esterase/lipase
MIAGDSAGAVTALWVGYAMTDRPGHSGNPGFSDAVGAVVSVSGEMKSQAFCKTVTPTPLNCTLSDPSKVQWPRLSFTLTLQ